MPTAVHMAADGQSRTEIPAPKLTAAQAGSGAVAAVHDDPRMVSRNRWVLNEESNPVTNGHAFSG